MEKNVDKYAAIVAEKRRARARRDRTRDLTLQVFTVGLVVAIWYFVSERQLVTSLLVPRVPDTMSALLQGLGAGPGSWWPDIAVTLHETVLGFLFGVLSGLLVGTVFAFVSAIRTGFYPIVIALMSLPKIAIAPLLLVAFGYGYAPKVIIAAMLAFFPVMTSATSGLIEVDRDELNLMKVIRASKWQELRYLRLPNAMSYIFPSLDVALIGALLGAVAAELIGAQAGIGYVIAQQQAYGDVAGMYGSLFMLSGIGILLHVVVAVVQRVLPPSIVPKSR